MPVEQVKDCTQIPTDRLGWFRRELLAVPVLVCVPFIQGVREARNHLDTIGRLIGIEPAGQIVHEVIELVIRQHLVGGGGAKPTAQVVDQLAGSLDNLGDNSEIVDVDDPRRGRVGIDQPTVNQI